MIKEDTLDKKNPNIKRKMLLVFEHLLKTGLITREEYNEALKITLQGDY